MLEPISNIIDYVAKQACFCLAWLAATVVIYFSSRSAPTHAYSEAADQPLYCSFLVCLPWVLNSIVRPKMISNCNSKKEIQTCFGIVHHFSHLKCGNAQMTQQI